MALATYNDDELRSQIDELWAKNKDSLDKVFLIDILETLTTEVIKHDKKLQSRTDFDHILCHIEDYQKRNNMEYHVIFVYKLIDKPGFVALFMEICHQAIENIPKGNFSEEVLILDGEMMDVMLVESFTRSQVTNFIKKYNCPCYVWSEDPYFKSLKN